MTFEELKAEAEKQGYSLIKKQKKYLLKCPECGKQPEAWRIIRNGNWFYRCQCGKESEVAKTKAEAGRLWNALVERKES